MFNFLKPKAIPYDKIETVIGSHTSFEGHLKCDGNVRIDGVCYGGVIETVGNVVVSTQGRVAAKIIAQHVSVAGQVTGAIEAKGYLEILSTGRVLGDVRVSNFYKDEAGVLSGKLEMTGVKKKSVSKATFTNTTAVSSSNGDDVKQAVLDEQQTTPNVESDTKSDIKDASKSEKLPTDSKEEDENSK